MYTNKYTYQLKLKETNQVDKDVLHTNRKENKDNSPAFLLYEITLSVSESRSILTSIILFFFTFNWFLMGSKICGVSLKICQLY